MGADRPFLRKLGMKLGAEIKSFCLLLFSAGCMSGILGLHPVVILIIFNQLPFADVEPHGDPNEITIKLARQQSQRSLIVLAAGALHEELLYRHWLALWLHQVSSTDKFLPLCVMTLDIAAFILGCILSRDCTRGAVIRRSIASFILTYLGLRWSYVASSVVRVLVSGTCVVILRAAFRRLDTVYKKTIVRLENSDDAALWEEMARWANGVIQLYPPSVFKRGKELDTKKKKVR